MRKLRSAILFALITLALLEVVLQVYYRVSVGAFLYERMAIPIYAPDPDRCYAVAPNLEYVHRTQEYEVVYRTNGDGFRVSDQKASGVDDAAGDVLRVLVLGPSFAFGWANRHDDSFAARVARRLDRPEQPVDLLNLGTPGQRIGQQLCWVQRQAARFRPGLIIQTVYGRLGSIAKLCETTDCPVVRDGFLLRPDTGWRERLVENSKRSAIVFYSWYLTQRIRVAADVRERMYFLVDVHLTPAGNAVVAKESARFLMGNDL